MTKPKQSATATSAITKYLTVRRRVVLVVLATILIHHLLPPSPYVLFSNDGPVSAMMAEQKAYPDVYLGGWQDLNWLGDEMPPNSIGVSAAIQYCCHHAGLVEALTISLLLFLFLNTTPAEKLVRVWVLVSSTLMVVVMIYAMLTGFRDKAEVLAGLWSVGSGLLVLNIILYLR